MHECYHRLMERLSLYYPVEPHLAIRIWGIEDERYRRFGFKRHNGVDLALPVGDSIRTPFPSRVVRIGNEHEGAGIFVCLLSTEPLMFDDGVSAYVEITFMHLLLTIVAEGDELSAGELIALGGLTGYATYATGGHTHMAPKRVTLGTAGYEDIDHNDAGNTFDPGPYWNGKYAEDLKTDNEVTLARLQTALTSLLTRHAIDT